MTRDDTETEEAGESGEPVVVAPEALAPATLRSLVEAFVLREGTDYGLREVGLDQKVQDVLRQLASGKARIVFDPATESTDIQVHEDPRAARRRPPRPS